jgi:cytochrome c
MQLKNLCWLVALLGPGLALADVNLAKSKNCLACHAIDKSMVGPAFQEVAAKYRGDKSAPDYLAQKILKGGDGVWGSMAMPSNAQVSEAQAKRLAAWVLSLK